MAKKPTDPVRNRINRMMRMHDSGTSTVTISRSEHRCYDVTWVKKPGYNPKMEVVLTDQYIGWKESDLSLPYFRKSAEYPTLPITSIREVVLIQGCFWFHRPYIRIYSAHQGQTLIRTFPAHHGIATWIRALKEVGLPHTLLPAQKRRGLLFDFRNRFHLSIFGTILPTFVFSIIFWDDPKRPYWMPVTILAAVAVLACHNLFERLLAKRRLSDRHVIGIQ